MKKDTVSPKEARKAPRGLVSTAPNTTGSLLELTSKRYAPKEEEPKDSSFWMRIAILVLVGIIFLGGLVGGLLYMDQKGQLEEIRQHLAANDRERSTAQKSGKYYKETEETKKVARTEKNNANGIAAYGDDSGEVIAPDYEEDYDWDDTDWDDSEWDYSDWDDSDWEEDYENDRSSGANGKPGGYVLSEGSKQGDLSGYTIILDPGHGGRDTGCVFPFNDPKYSECDFNLSIALSVREELLSRGATVYLLRSDNSWVSLYNRLAQVHLICLDIAEAEGKLPFSQSRANELRNLLQTSIDINEDTVASGGMGIMVGSGVGPELEELFEMEYKLDHVLFLSIHLNSSESRSQHGTQLYYVTDDSVIESERNQRQTNSEFQRSDFPLRDEYYGRHNEDNSLLACCIYDNIVGNLPQLETNGHPVNADNYAVLREHGLTGVLIEVAFLSDDADRKLLQSDSNVQTISISIGNGVEMYFQQKGI